MTLFPIEKQTTDSIRKSLVSFLVREFPPGKVAQEQRVKHSVLVYVMKGSMTATVNGVFTKKVKAGEIALLPKMCLYTLDVEEDVYCVCCSFIQHLSLSRQFSISQLSDYLPAIEEREYDCFTLQVNEIIHDYFVSLDRSLSEGLESNLYNNIKVHELFYLLDNYFSPEDLAHFFYPLLGKQIDFKEFVYDNFCKVQTVQEFADLSNMSIDTFKRRFKESFDMSVHKWMVQRKSEMIYQDLMDNQLSLVDISVKYGFSSQSYLTTFCKRHLNCSPLELRNSNLNLLEDV